MKYGGRDLYKEWDANQSNEVYSEYIKRNSESINVAILKKYAFLLDLGYGEIKNMDNQIVRFERKQDNYVFRIYYPNMSAMELNVYYDELQTSLDFNGDGEYDECITISGFPVSMDVKNIRHIEQKLIKTFNDELEKLKFKEAD